MKRRLLSICLLFLCISTATIRAQFYVKNDGKVAVGDDSFTQGLFNVSSNTGQIQPQLAFIRSSESSCALEICNFTQSNMLYSSDDVYGLRSIAGALENRRAIGVQTFSYPSGSSVNGTVIGLLASAGGGTYGYNYGVCTSLSGSQNGAGIYASSGSNPDGVQIQGKYAGYFNGNVNILGTLTATIVTQTSDYRLKDNIRQLDNRNLERLMNLNVVKYAYKNYEINAWDSIDRIHYAFEEDSPILKSDHFGLIAQELKEIYPELVTEGGDGYLSVNYIELIPILIKSVQELKAKVDALDGKTNNAPVRTGGTTYVDSQLSMQATLYQNSPNPFTENTTVRCIIPKGISKAVLYIYDMNGHQIDSMPIAERGDVSLTIEGSSLDAGIYMYSLITDGEVVDTKRLILTK